MPKGFYVTTVLKIKNSDDVSDIVTALKKLEKNVLEETNCTLFLAQKDTLDKKNIIIWERFDDKSDFYEHIGKDYILHFFDETKVNIVKHFQTEWLALS